MPDAASRHRHAFLLEFQLAKNVVLTSDEARDLIHNALTGSGTSPENAGYFTEAILDTELSGLEGHGFYWLQYYCAHLHLLNSLESDEPKEDDEASAMFDMRMQTQRK